MRKNQCKEKHTKSKYFKSLVLIIGSISSEQNKRKREEGTTLAKNVCY